MLHTTRQVLDAAQAAYTVYPKDSAPQTDVILPHDNARPHTTLSTTQID